MTNLFGLTSIGTLLVAITVMVGISAATIIMWGRLVRIGGWAWPVRTVLFATSQLAVVLVTALVLNNGFVFYQSWAELFGAHPRQDQPVVAAGKIDARYEKVLALNARKHLGTVIPLAIPGTVSGVRTSPGLAYLPPQYGDPAYRDRSFPVVELLDGFPGSPATWTHTLHVQNVLTGLINSGRAAPFVAVMPEQNVASPRDTECVNVKGGPQVDTYLSVDVRTAVRHSLRVDPVWTALGYSTGGYCATDLTLRHPSLFSAAASLEGYNIPAHDSTTHHLFALDPSGIHDYTAGWILQHHPTEAGHLLLIASRGDHYSYRASQQLLRQAGYYSQVSVSTLILARGGHNFTTVSAELPSAFGWLSRYVPTALAPIPTVDGMAPAPAPAHPAHGPPLVRQVRAKHHHPPVQPDPDGRVKLATGR